MWHVFDYLQNPWRIYALAGLFVLTLIVAIKTNQPLKPFRIVALELAPNPEAAKIIIDRWKQDDSSLAAARLLQQWDNYFILCYSTFLALACVIVADWLYPLGTTANFQGKLLAWLMWIAAILDYVENHAINKMLDGNIENPWPKVSNSAASFKFIIIAAGVVYILSGILVGLLRKGRG
jgi:hypothetical protein